MRTILLLFVLLATSAQAQILKSTNLNLNSGGVIHDVAYDSYYDAYIVVGEFTSINNQPRQNLAFIDATTFNVMNKAPITGINGAIRSVEVVNNVPYIAPNSAIGSRNYIYLGGNFTTINSNTRICVARLFAEHLFSPIPTLANYMIQTNWDAQLYWDNSLGPEYGVHDFHLMGDTLITVGEFNNVLANYVTGNYNRKTISFDADDPNFQTKNLTFLNGAVDFVASGDQPLYGIEQLDDRLFLYGSASNAEIINEYHLNGTFVQQIENCSTSNSAVLDFEPHASSVDTILFAYEGASYASIPYYISSYQNSGTLWNCPGISLSNTMLDFPTMGQINYIESYKDYVFTAGSNTNTLFTTQRNGTANVPVLNSFNLNNNWFLNYPSSSGAPCLKVEDDLLFFSTDQLTSVDGSARTGLAVFCLEPRNAEPFTNFDNTACEGDSSLYTIPSAEFADGYRWSYSGSGVMYRTSGSGNAWLSLVSEHIASNSIELYFPVGTTAGTLSVEPYTVCNTSTDYQYSEGQTGAISINQVPTISLAPTHTLNCYSDTALIVVQSTMPNVDFYWLYNTGGSTSTNDTILITPTNGQGFDSSNYIVTVTDPLTGCFDSDTTYFTFDLVAADIDTSLVTTSPTEWNCLTDSMILSANQTGYFIQWEDPASPGTFLADPLTLYSAPNGSYNIHGMQLSNGCSTQIAYGAIPINTTPAGGTLANYTYINGGVPIDTLTCDNPSIIIECEVTAPFTSNSTAQWLDTLGLPTGTNQLTLTEQDANGTSFIVRQFQTINNDNGCTQTYNVQVLCNFAQPLVPTLANQTINCSQSEILLSHPINGSANVTEGWLNGTTQTNSDTMTIYSAGEYYYQVTSDTNGCWTTDTVIVIQTLDLVIDMPSDTLICPDEVVSISPLVVGNTETPSYLWNDGSTNSTQTATGGVDGELIVTVSTPSGCTGTDTILVLITAPVSTEVQGIIGCTDGSLQVISSTGGAGNYEYSLNSNTWQTALNFSNLAFGNYTIYTRDDLGCVYDTTQSLNGTASSVEMNFVASTYNEQGDTLLLVNVTDYTALDSVSWSYPVGANVIFENDSISLVSMLAEGWYDVELIGYEGPSCEYSFTKPVYFGGQSPVFNDSLEFNGIDSVNVFPVPVTNGTFTVYVEFGKTQNYTIVVTNNLGQPVPTMSSSGVGQIITQPFAFPSGTASGFYRVHIIGDYDARQIQITLN